MSGYFLIDGGAAGLGSSVRRNLKFVMLIDTFTISGFKIDGSLRKWFEVCDANLPSQ